MIAYTHCYSGLGRLANRRAVLSLGGISLLHREMKLSLRVMYVQPGVNTNHVAKQVWPVMGISKPKVTMSHLV